MHDAKGRDLKVGDKVVIPCTIQILHTDPDYCNVDLLGDYDTPKMGRFHSGAINTKQILRANDGDEN